MRFAIAAALSTAALVQDAAAAALAGPNWPGWEKLNYLVVFGDSYTQQGFNASGAQPDEKNPIGNPAYPGYTSSGGENWIDFMTTKYNESKLFTYNFAYGGATVDSSLVKPYRTDVLSLEDQVNNQYLKNYNATHLWSAKDSLFVFWLGINDVGNSYSSLKGNNSVLYGKIIEEYRAAVEAVYTSGARNFLFMLVPPVQRSPLTQSQGSDAVTRANITAVEKIAIFDFNTLVNSLGSSTLSRHNDTTVFTFDTYTLFDNILNNATVTEQTKGIKNTTGYYSSNSTMPVEQYFWRDNLHPTVPVHNATAAEVVKFIKESQPKPMVRRTHYRA